MLRHIDQMRQRAHHHHIGGPGIAGGAGQFINGQPIAAVIPLQLEIVGIIDDQAALPHFLPVGIVSLPVKRHQHIHIIPGAEDAVHRDPRLRPGRPAHNLRRESGVSQGVVAHLG